jgi:hypothetical protein
MEVGIFIMYSPSPYQMCRGPVSIMKEGDLHICRCPTIIRVNGAPTEEKVPLIIDEGGGSTYMQVPHYHKGKGDIYRREEAVYQ